jgi:hypothetical protein
LEFLAALEIRAVRSRARCRVVEVLDQPVGAVGYVPAHRGERCGWIAGWLTLDRELDRFITSGLARRLNPDLASTGKFVPAKLT